MLTYKISKGINKIKDNYLKVFGILIVVAAIFCFFTMLYGDNLDNSLSGYQFLDSLLSGRFIEFYNQFDWSYGVTIYAIYAIWSFPVWLFFRIFKLTGNINEYVSVLLWYKLLLVIFFVWSIFLLKKIIKLCYEDTNEILIQYLSSPILFFVIFYIAQCDIIGICFSLLGIYYYINNKNKLFIVMFAIASTMKFFALIVFIPLILYKEKRIYKVIEYIFGGISLVVLTKILTSFSNKVQIANSDPNFYVNRHLSYFSSMGIQISDNMVIGLFGFSFIVLCSIAFCWDFSEKDKVYDRTLWIALSGYMCFCLFYPSNFYWNIVVIPFMTLVSFSKKKYLKLNIIFEIIFTICTLIIFAYKQFWVFMGESIYSYLLLKDISIYMTQNSIQYILNHFQSLNITENLPILEGFKYSCIFGFLLINYPDLQQGVRRVSEEDQADIILLTGIKIFIIYLFIAMSFVYLIRSYYFH